jgi:hypothetical protein
MLASCLSYSSVLNTEPIYSSETLIGFRWTKGRYNPKYRNLYKDRCGSLEFKILSSTTNICHWSDVYDANLQVSVQLYVFATGHFTTPSKYSYLGLSATNLTSL